ncbi:glycosyltransferase family 39 protein [Candidatus Microgenomates bacterium]|nr:glycosyltransferase family 39 protein [Candidatus Microgenomates bacterium]
MQSLKKEITVHKFIYLLLGTILLVAFFLRVYRINSLLGFYFDQGRDALVIWDLIKFHKFFLIGPTTGLAGIFRGPYYYYLIAPFYFLGQGDPVFPSIFLSFTTVCAILLGYHLGAKTQSMVTGIVFAILSSFSFYIVIASRWLSNPTPMLLLSLILVFAMFKVIEGKNWGWPVIGFVSGLSLFNFGSSGELFYLPAIFVFLIWQWKNRPNVKNLILTIILFCVTFAPLILFDLKHEHILLNNILKTFGQESSFTLPSIALFELRNHFYIGLFPKLLFHSIGFRENIFLVVLLLSFILFLPKLVKNTKVKILLLLLMSPLLGLYFYQGNDKVLYDYYMTGYFLIFLLLISVILGNLWKYKLGQVFVIMFLSLFLINNFNPTKFVLTNPSDQPGAINYINQKQVIDWIYTDAKGQEFNVDIYVPPVIPYAYDYLFTWYGPKMFGYAPKKENIKLLYTLYEQDPPHPERLDAWLDRQKGIGKVLEKYTSGGITVERRLRLK